MAIKKHLAAQRARAAGARKGSAAKHAAAALRVLLLSILKPSVSGAVDLTDAVLRVVAPVPLGATADNPPANGMETLRSDVPTAFFEAVQVKTTRERKHSSKGRAAYETEYRVRMVHLPPAVAAASPATLGILGRAAHALFKLGAAVSWKSRTTGGGRMVAVGFRFSPGEGPGTCVGCCKRSSTQHQNRRRRRLTLLFHAHPLGA